MNQRQMEYIDLLANLRELNDSLRGQAQGTPEYKRIQLANREMTEPERQDLTEFIMGWRIVK